MKELVTQFGHDQHLSGVITLPDGQAQLGLIVLTAGILHKQGPNRMYVRLCRAVAEVGFTAMRFDASGIGDSGRRKDPLDRNSLLVADVVDAIRELKARSGVQGVILAGLCSGAFTAFTAATQAPDVHGIAMLNPEALVGDLAWEKHVWALYYRKRSAKRAKSWINLLRGKVKVRRLVAALKSTLGTGPDRELISTIQSDLRSQADHLCDCGIPQLVIVSAGGVPVLYGNLMYGRDLSLGDVPAPLRYHMLMNTDHNFTTIASQQAVIGYLTDWMRMVMEEKAKHHPT